ncbi:transcription factor TCP18 [Ziziphus jujuba]|uniref:Transcription factor TCP18 n=2 Tax=Ziziphus jujuba TaxID=326968 RepID=A0ABM3IK66_ZIZJJ|nr:transcription factor TCP18 [Ziziphus jujuba]KAH7528798.1 hypothetical protein FEM48_Zijuj05G0110500 [Ziziphus jujuba var. spinosa]
MMFPSNSCNGDDQAFFYRTFLTNNDTNNIIPNSKQQQQQQQDPLLPLPLPSPSSLSSFFYLPSPFEEEEEEVVHHDLLLQNQPDLVFQSHHELLASEKTVSNKSPTTTTSTMVEYSSSDVAAAMKTTTTMNIQNHIMTGREQNNVTELVQQQQLQQQIPRKRSCKRDRHSKINTARGPRDRRMRLSLEVARKFFGLQDMLGFDKASKTVAWLLIQAKSEIKKLARELKKQPSSCSAAGTKSSTTCSTSECEVVSGTDEVALIDGGDDDDDHHRRCGRKSSSSSAKEMMKKKKKSRQLSRKNAFDPLARESRDKARARARERTREREKLRRLVGGDESKVCDHEATNNNQENPCRLGSSWSPFEFETGEESGTQSQNMNPTNSLAEDMVDDDSLVIMQGKWSPSSIFNSLQSTGISQEHQFSDLQFFGKPWDICNTHNLC